MTNRVFQRKFHSRTPVTGDTTITLPVGGNVEITSPNYPANYDDFVYKEWEIVAPPGHRVLLNFTDFSLESCCDYLTVYDAYDGQQASSLSGSTIPEDILSQGQSLRLEFTTDGSVSFQGFRLEASGFNPSRKRG